MALSPMMQQYLRIHDQYADCLLLFRLGDFYELFFEDAKTASRELELTLTGKDCGLEERAPMCGVPYHSVNTYIEKLIAKGYKVAICEQMEDPALAKGLVDRDVVRVITAGTVTDPAMLEDKANNYLMCVYLDGKKTGIAYADVSTGEFFVMEPEVNLLRAQIVRVNPMEVICNDPPQLTALTGGDIRGLNGQPRVWFQRRNAEDTICEHFHLSQLTSLGLDDKKEATCAAGALLRYLHETQKNSLEHIRTLRIAENGKTMLLDQNTRRNLELTESLRGERRKGTLLGLLDLTSTAMGGRLLRRWVEQPLLDEKEINNRLDAVEELVNDRILGMTLAEELEGVYDMERLMNKVAYRNMNARDCLALCASLKRIPGIRNLLINVQSAEMIRIHDELNPLEELTDLLDRAIHPDAPVIITEGGIIREGYSQILDEYREAQTSGKQWILDLEAREREETGIRNLRIQYNKVFGYYIEVTKSFLSQVPERYIRKQTLTNAERYMTPELKEIEQKIIGAQEQSVRLELQLFSEVRDRIAEQIEGIQRTAQALKELDVFQSLSRAASENHYVRPSITSDGTLSIVEGRHPVVERNMKDGGFIPNDTLLDGNENRMMIITGPNMAGKSTYMRQVALICLMAQIGSFVPAREASLPVCDRIFTRVGASDDLASGQSTFMVEMSETAHILRNATKNSLIILDEIGRGTSTFDGLSIAWAVVEYIADKERIGAKTLFATHYHELSELEGHLDGVKNFCISVKEHGEDVIFLRKIVRGGADKSFGVHVARLAGVPHPVIVRAHEIQARLEVSEINQNTIGQNILGEDTGFRKNEQMDLFEYKKDEIIKELQEIDVMAITPMDAMNTLFLLREKARKL
ncbi:DNA mismatch repair protein MutS [Aristaeella hokkaidonensis]|uniref:DNA mismatch repair protein MutS n=1 Tax=Aristaeella hokkaidonensis TaxID=3046382 RepID=A0AC61MY02_9FIRM|nr:DNA mismatch repair protein MutS [Aristaeella hokkaidonensis]QUC67915.1 DNA mismatch repair protein MutS [Aristaeella hokkaidonensis]SNT92982.1 DNA mismatch repair protein MutS [Aristaeella hokkaidonensis]